MKTVVYTRVALRSLQAHRNRAKQIRAKIDQYALNPAALANNVIQLTGSSSVFASTASGCCSLKPK
jgi:mRNA interferase RelE/StbE